MNLLNNYLLSRSKRNSQLNANELFQLSVQLDNYNFQSKAILLLSINNQNLDKSDLEKSLKMLKGLKKIETVKKNQLKLFFTNFQSSLRCVLLFGILQEKSLLTNFLTVTYLRKEEQENNPNQNKAQQEKKTVRKSNCKNAPKKFTGRFYILVDNSKGFEIAKKIIGKKGKNMKYIIEQSKFLSQQKYVSKDFLKLRLRGKGSLYKEGNKKQECNDQLHLCVSAKTSQILFNACQLIEKLLNKLHKEYLSFCKRKRLSPKSKFYSKVLEIKKNQLNSNLNNYFKFQINSDHLINNAAFPRRN